MTLRGGLIGAGNIALRGHLPQWTSPALTADAQIVAVADLCQTNLAAARKALPDARLYETAEALLAAETLDFCDICAPPYVHRALVEEAARRRLHIVCEKPIAGNLADAEAMAATVRNAGIVFVPCHQYHYSPHWQAVKGLLPKLGRIYLVEYEVLRTEANPGNPNWAPTWRTDRSLAGGGILFDHGAHIFYQLRSALGDPLSILATVRTLRHSGYGVEDSAFVTLDYGDRLAQVRLTWAARRREIRFRFVGEQGELAGDDKSLTLTADTTQEISFDDGMSKDSSHSEWYAPLFRDFVARVHSGSGGHEPLDEAVSVTRLITRAYESSEDGRALLLAARTPAVVGKALAAVEAAVERVAVAEDAEAQPQSPAVRRGQPWLVRGLALAMLAASASWALHGVDWAALRQAFHAADPLWVAVAAVANMVAIYAMAGRWLAVLKPLSRKATWPDAFRSMIVGFAVSSIVPARAGELARAEWLGRRTGLPRITVLSSIVLDHLVNGVGMFAGIAALPLFFSVPSWLRPGIALALGVFAAAVVGVFYLRPRNGVATLADATPPPARGMRGIVARFVRHAREGLWAVRDRRALGWSLAASLLAWTLEICVILFTLHAFGLQLPLAATFLLLMAVNLALVVPFAPPGNLGMLELGAMLALIEFGVPKEQALAIALTYHILQIIPIGIAATAFGGFAVLSPTAVPETGRT